jgi:uncharacterized membrane protein
MTKNESSSVEATIDVAVPVSVAYNQWTQFEDFPKFMEGVESVEQLDDRRLRWRAEIAGKKLEWLAEITEQSADQRIAWRSVSGAQNAGVVTFHHIAEGKCRVALQLDYDPEGIVENIGSFLGVVSRRATADLERFKAFIEARGQATGAWRGEIAR